MFAVPKYSQALEALRQERNVEGLFQHNLVRIDAKDKVATFKNLAEDGKEVQRPYGFLHVVPPQKPWDWVAKSPLGTFDFLIFRDSSFGGQLNIILQALY